MQEYPNLCSTALLWHSPLSRIVSQLADRTLVRKQLVLLGEERMERKEMWYVFIYFAYHSCLL